MKRGGLLTVLMLLGLAGGAAVGQVLLFNEHATLPDSHWMRSAGELILVRPLMLLVAPLVLAGMVVAVARIGESLRLAVVASATLLYFLATMLLAVIVGAALVEIARPGEGFSPALAARLQADGTEAYIESESVRAQIEIVKDHSVSDAWKDLLHTLVPTNVVTELMSVRPLGVLLFGLLLGLALAASGERGAVVVAFFEGLLAALIIVARWIAWLAPAGLFLLVAWTVGRIGLGELVGPLTRYLQVVIGGLAVHGLLVLPAILFVFGRTDPFAYMWKMRRALLVAFGTSSSAATLPMTVESAVSDGGCSTRAAGFVVPLGAMVNLNGTALYETVAVVFLFQFFGVTLDFAQILVVAVTAALAAVGTAGIPSAGLVAMALVITSVNRTLPADVSPLPLTAIGVILAVDRIVDMCRTTVNVWGDAVGAKIMTKLAPDETPKA